MRIKSVQISKYKNLKDFKSDFENSSFLEILVGKNGSGKSNFLEAIAEIFQHLFEFQDKNIGPSFEYSITLISKVKQEIAWRPGQLTLDGINQENTSLINLPENIIIYYSGHNNSMRKIVEKYESQIVPRMRSKKFESVGKFVGIDTSQNDMLLTLLMLQNDDSVAKNLALERLNIKSIEGEIKLTLKRPIYFKSRINQNNVIEEKKFWNVKKSIREFINELVSCKSLVVDGPERAEGYLYEEDHYIVYLDSQKIKQVFQKYSNQEIYRKFDEIRIIGMLASISVSVALANGEITDSNSFSDGQFQSLCIYSISEFFKDKEYIALLDEPDAFLHPEWQYLFLNNVNKITPPEVSRSQIIMTSHSAVTLIPSENAKIRFIETKGDTSKFNSIPKSIAINKLSSALISYTERDRMISIIQKAKTEDKPVLFTEGSTDPDIIRVAWEKLNPNIEMPFTPIYAFSCTYIKQLLTDKRIHKEMGGKALFALFDFDKAYDHWNGLNGETIQRDVSKGLIKKWEGGEVFAIMLPIPKNAEIRRQVFKNETEMETFGGDSRCEIEHLFYGSSHAEDYFSMQRAIGGEIVAFKSDDKKTEFSQVVVQKIEKIYFEVFGPIFDFIVEKSKVEVPSSAAD